MKKVLAFVDEPVDAIITSYDGLAIGAVKALEDYDYAGGIVITGQDAEIEAIKAIVDGKMTLTVYKSIKTISSAAIDLAMEIAKGKKGSGINSTVNNGRVDVPTVLLTPVAVDKNNIKETIIADGFFNKEQVYGE
jgi:D-xylose transport system substrate-binding protein